MKLSDFIAAIFLFWIAQFTFAENFDSVADIKKAEQTVQVARNTLSNPALTKKAARQARNELISSLEIAGTLRSFVGDVQGAMSAFDEMSLLEGGVSVASSDDFQRLGDAIEEDAIKAIIQEADKHQIVILNEAHYIPMHRAFAMRLARELHRIGYTWLACETCGTTPFGKGYLSVSDGYYSREPVFGNFLRDAIGDGWRLVDYEYSGSSSTDTFAAQIERREIGQATNLVERIFSKHSDAKVFIYVGYSHVREKPQVGDGTGPAWLAAQLRHLTGLDPLTIDQISMTEHADPAAETSLYAAALNREHRSMPFVLRSKSGGYEVFGPYRFAVDMQVVHPRYGVDIGTGRPTWMRSLAGFEEVDVPKKMQDAATPHFLFAYLEGQPDDSVPADVVQIVPGLPIPKFMLPSGEFRFEIRP